MEPDALGVYAPSAVRDRSEDRHVDAARPTDRSPDLEPGGPPYRPFWARLLATAPGDPPDERYLADEVRPTGPTGDGLMQWETFAGALAGIVVHNVAEAEARSHLLAAETVVRVEARLDRRSPPDMVYLTFVPPAAEVRQQVARVVSYAGGAYTVQPVRREGGQFVDDGDPVAGVPNVGELWPDEAGYLNGPSEYDRYVPLTWTASGWIIVLHPPRMV
jgi:hypothetical protein